jgi:uncharacterized LabA/DUF88 family protein
MNMEENNNYAFIDSQNLNLSIEEIGWHLDFKKLYVYLKYKHKTAKTFLFIGYIKGNEYLYNKLQSYGYIIIFKPTLDDRGKIKGNCDAELVLHCMINYYNFTKAIIISGDGDFYCLIKYLSENNKLLKIGIPNKFKYSSLLREHSKYFFFISDLKTKLSSPKK